MEEAEEEKERTEEGEIAEPRLPFYVEEEEWRLALAARSTLTTIGPFSFLSF